MVRYMYFFYHIFLLCIEDVRTELKGKNVHELLADIKLKFASNGVSTLLECFCDVDEKLLRWNALYLEGTNFNRKKFSKKSQNVFFFNCNSLLVEEDMRYHKYVKVYYDLISVELN